MALKWIANGVFSFEGKEYGYGDTMPNIPKKLLDTLKSRGVVGRLLEAVPAISPEVEMLLKEVSALKAANNDLTKQLEDATKPPEEDKK